MEVGPKARRPAIFKIGPVVAEKGISTDVHHSRDSTKAIVARAVHIKVLLVLA